MNKQTPRLLSLLRMRDILAPHAQDIRKLIYIDEHLAIVHGSMTLLQHIISHQPPFTFDDRRLGLITGGEATVNINLVDKTLKPGTLIFIGPGTIITPLHFTPDFQLYGFGIPADFPLPAALPQTMNGQLRDFQLQADNEDILTVQHILDTLWHLVHQTDYSLPVASSLIYAQMQHYDTIYRHYLARQQNHQTRDQTIFDRFIQLVNLYAQHEHQIAFYAQRLCLTERYLGTVVRQTSGCTPKEWIDRAIAARIKVELRHTDKTITQISDEMNFTNPSFFNKYFKRLTGMTPITFRNH